MAVGGERTVTARLRADVGQYVANMGIAAKATRDMATTATKSAKDHSQAWTTAGTALVGFGAVAVGAVGVAAKAAIDWESAWAGVRKTVDGSDAEMASLEAELRQLARTLPATHQEIAAVAEAAGQLGVKREAIVGFTRTMIALGETTNLSADEAATAIAQMANIMGTSQGDVDRLGAALVALGNDGASTEREILSMGMRIAGAGKTIGLTEGEVLAFANALASMGVEAEAGGTAISTVMLKVQQAVDAGGDDLVKFARVAGLSAADFKTAFEDDAAGALQLFVEGLGRADAAGENTTGIMDDLGFEGIRVTDTLRRLAGNSDLLADSLRLGNQAWADNTALVKEAEERYDTTAARIQVAQNNIRDAGITLGQSMLPVIDSLASGVVGLVDAFNSIPEPLQRAAAPTGAVIGGFTLVGGAALLAVPKIVEFRSALNTLSTDMPRLSGALQGLGKAVGIVGAVVGTFAAINAAVDSGNRAILSTAEATSALLEMSKGVQDVDEAVRSLRAANAGVGFSSLAEGLESVANPGLTARLSDVTAEILSLGGDNGRASRQDLLDQLNQFGQAMAFLVESGNAEMAAEQFEAFEAAAAAAGMPVADLLDLMPAYRDALASTANQSELAAQATEPLTTGLSGVQLTAEEAQASLDGLSQSLQAIFTDMFSVEEATDAYQQALVGLAESAKGADLSLQGNSAAALANRAQMRGLVQDGLSVIDTMAQQGATSDELKAQSAQLRDEFIRQAVQLGYNEADVRRYAAAFDEVPAIVDTTVRAETAQAIQAIQHVRDELVKLGDKTITVTTRLVTSGRGPANAQGPGQATMSAAGNAFTTIKGGRIDAKAFAAGGDVPNGHVAQHAPAGAWRVWAEDETGGETYIPHADDWRRPRAVSLTRDVASMFGFDLVPRGGVKAFAIGGIAGPAGAARASDAGVSRSFSFNVRTERAWTPAEALQLVARAEAMYL